ncbi:hypothetical protein [Mycolicibacterium doricum]|uniref:hypothetical protein n=1 Tax=Mycolicibacterium doricum TaxID=126673 RepID=UPI0013D2F1B4|nr:hypothetical protein [Mycolicibacterium doricum]
MATWSGVGDVAQRLPDTGIQCTHTGIYRRAGVRPADGTPLAPNLLDDGLVGILGWRLARQRLFWSC